MRSRSGGDPLHNRKYTAAARRMEEKNYQIDSENSRREIEGLRLKAQQESVCCFRY